MKFLMLISALVVIQACVYSDTKTMIKNEKKEAQACKEYDSMSRDKVRIDQALQSKPLVELSQVDQDRYLEIQLKYSQVKSDCAQARTNLNKSQHDVKSSTEAWINVPQNLEGYPDTQHPVSPDGIPK